MDEKGAEDVPAGGGSAGAAAAGSAGSDPARASLAVVADEDEEEVSTEVYLGVVKSYNDRRGFGFLACAETAAQFGRDVYMPKAEATAAAAEAAAASGEVPQAAAATAVALPVAATGSSDKGKDEEKEKAEKAEKPPPAPRLAEEDLVQFRVKLSIEGYPQAARVKRLRKFPGVVVRLPAEVGADGTEDDGAPGAIASDEAAKAHGITEVPVRRSACGQVRLAVGDEVTFCMPAVADAEEANGPGACQDVEARLVFLSKTSRSSRSVLGCFTLDLPRTGVAEEAAPRPNLRLDCHAFGDKLILAGLPADLEEAELMRFFSKQGATGAVVAHARTCSFASVSFPGTVEVARFIGRTAHAFADEKETRIAKLLALTPTSDTARLPALPSPSLSWGEEAGSILVVWSPLVLAVAYTVELRPAGGAWATVDVASSHPGASGNRFDSDCSSCKVTGLQAGSAYEARVSYFTECGTRSEASEPSEQCVPAPLPQAPAVAPGVGSGLGAAEGFGAAAGHPDFATAGDFGAGYPPPGHAPLQVMQPAQPAWHSWVGADGLPQDGGFAPALPVNVPGWRSITGMVVPPPAMPELRAADDHGFAVSIQWPTVLQAAAYVVELREAGSTAVERFVRSAPEAKLGALVELRVGGLRPGPAHGRVYVAQVRTVGTDGSESAPSPPGWSPPLGGQLPASADAAAWQPYVASDTSAPPPPLPPSTAAPSAVPAPVAPPSAPPLAAPPAAPPPPQPPAWGLGNWAPSPWLGQAEPGGATWGPLGDLTSGAYGPHGAAPGAFGAPPGTLAAPTSAPVPPIAPGAPSAEVAGVPWGAPGAPPPPPAGPPPLVQPGQRREDPPPEASGHEECLILD